MPPETFEVREGDALTELVKLPSGIARTCVTSPPYWAQRDYGVEGQIGLELRVDDYVARLVEVFRELRRVLADDGTLWLNLGDTFFGGGYSNHRVNGDRWAREMNGDKRRTRQQDLIRANPELKPKDLVGVPWRVAFALRADGWWLRSDVIWEKSRAMPESVRDRPARAHEYVFLLAKSRRYYYSREGGRDVWCCAPQSFKGAHFAVMPERLAEPAVLATSEPGDLVIDPFCGAGTTGVVAVRAGRRFVGVELNAEYAALARARMADPRANLA